MSTRLPSSPRATVTLTTGSKSQLPSPPKLSHFLPLKPTNKDHSYGGHEASLAKKAKEAENAILEKAKEIVPEAIKGTSK